MLGLAAGLVGVGFKTVLYRLEDLVDRLWKGRPEWARPAVGGLALGVLLLALPQMYGVGYPVMDKVDRRPRRALADRDPDVWQDPRLEPHALDRRLGGVFAPSLFTGAAGGMAFGMTRPSPLRRRRSGPPAMYAVIAMGGVFAGAAQAPLTAIASVVEMTGNFTLTLP